MQHNFDLPITRIKKHVCDAYNVLLIEMTSSRQHRQVVIPRHIAMYLARHLTKASFPKIAMQFKKDHTTVIGACKRIEDRMLIDPDFSRRVKALSAELEEKLACN